MRNITIALLLLVPIAAAAQPPNRARAYTKQVFERSSANPDRKEQARQPDRRDRRDQRNPRVHDRRPQTHGPGFKERRFRQSFRDQRFRQRPPFFGSYYAVPYTGYGFPYYVPGPAEENYERAPREENQAIVTTGVLRLEVTPASGLSYYVDGVYFGSSSNLGTQFALTAGARRIEVRATGYQPLMFDTRIIEGEITTFRAAMEPLEQPQAPPRATGNPTMFIIPGCYMGNARPSANELRAGCDINRLITR